MRPPRPWLQHGLIVLGLWTVSIGLFWPWIVSSPKGLADSGAYLAGFQAVRDGLSPYVHPRFLYPPLFAHAGAWLGQRLGLSAVAILLQLFDLLAASSLVWISLTLVVSRRGVRLIAAPVLLALLPPIGDSIRSGNVAVAIASLTLVVGLLWPRMPLLAGALLGLTLAAKPMALGLLPVLVLQQATSRRRSWLAAALAAALALASLGLYPEESLSMFRRASVACGARTVSLHAAFREMGLPIPALAITALVALAGGIIVHRGGRGLGVISLAYLSCAFSLCMLPVISTGSLALGVPLIVAAAAFVLRRVLQQWWQGAESKRRAVRDLLFVGVGAAAFCGGDSWSLWPEAPREIRGATMLIPLLALSGLTWFCLKTLQARERARSQGGGMGDVEDPPLATQGDAR